MAISHIKSKLKQVIDIGRKPISQRKATDVLTTQTKTSFQWTCVHIEKHQVQKWKEDRSHYLKTHQINRLYRS